MTEDEAKTKTCVQTLAAISDLTGGTNHSPAACIGSACMAWRWHEGKRAEAFHEAVREHMRASAKPSHSVSVQAVYAARGGEFERTEGFCGLAGSPQ
jgi:hypothetical protein